MTVLFAGTEQESFDTNATGFDTTAGRFNSAYVRGAMFVFNTDSLRTTNFAATGDIWVHWADWIGDANNAEFTGVMLRGNDGIDYIRIGRLSNTYVLQTWNGSSWVTAWNAGTNYTLKLNNIDVHLNNAASGELAIYVNSRLEYSDAGDYSGIDDIVSLEVVGRTGTLLRISEVIVANEMTIGWHIYYSPPAGDSADHSDWTNGYANVDEPGINDEDYISSDTAGQIELFTRDGISIPAGYNVKGVGATARARKSGVGPQNLQFALRFGSTDYASPSVSGLDGGFNGFVYLWELNPSTGLVWTNSDAEDATVQFGVKAIA